MEPYVEAEEEPCLLANEEEAEVDPPAQLGAPPFPRMRQKCNGCRRD